MTDVPELLAQIERAPKGPKVGAFFDFDGTLIAGYSASAFYQDRVRRFEFSSGELARSLLAGLEMAVRGADVTRLMTVAVESWAGRPEQEVRPLLKNDLWGTYVDQRRRYAVHHESACRRG